MLLLGLKALSGLLTQQGCYWWLSLVLGIRWKLVIEVNKVKMQLMEAGSL